MNIPGLAKEGAALVAVSALAAAALALADWWVAAALVGLWTLGCAAFFRDPERRAPSDENAVLSPADGKVVEVTELPGGARRVGIFLAVWNVHVNRSPCQGTVKGLRYEKGKFLAAFNPEAPTRNERNTLSLDTPHGEMTVTQIAGLIARRIVCRVKEGDVLDGGQRFGLIQFGSRVDCTLPPGVSVTVNPGDMLRAGESLLGRAGKGEAPS